MNRRQFLLAGSITAIGTGCSVPVQQARAVATGLIAIQERKAMPAFSLPNLDGNIVRSSDLIGNVVLLRFWATW
jgi:hypothetical protein